ncbi:DUF2975 domain-containing protein [Novosphingobium lentum]|uniref:DUF2975 domain-containing protein n=1 Tax=Novosphingobium lentum TaxID=145287 RepID=UPI000830018F|nr:DUF2975 domain-containing protein [Novosphingobium lentum]
MSRFRTDPLLGFSRLAVTFFMGVALLVSGALLVAAPAMLIAHRQVFDELASKAVGTSPTAIVAGIIAVMLMVSAMAVMGFLFLRTMRRIIDSVGLGDPFAPINADRLRLMGWLVVGIEVISIPIGAIVTFVSQHVADGSVKTDADFGFSLGGLLLAMILFILARVFRQGAQMRDELEGTV